MEFTSFKSIKPLNVLSKNNNYSLFLEKSLSIRFERFFCLPDFKSLEIYLNIKVLINSIL